MGLMTDCTRVRGDLPDHRFALRVGGQVLSESKHDPATRATGFQEDRIEKTRAKSRWMNDSGARMTYCQQRMIAKAGVRMTDRQ